MQCDLAAVVALHRGRVHHLLVFRRDQPNHLLPIARNSQESSKSHPRRRRGAGRIEGDQEGGGRGEGGGEGGGGGGRGGRGGRGGGGFAWPDETNVGDNRRTVGTVG